MSIVLIALATFGVLALIAILLICLNVATGELKNNNHGA